MRIFNHRYGLPVNGLLQNKQKVTYSWHKKRIKCSRYDDQCVLYVHRAFMQYFYLITAMNETRRHVISLNELSSIELASNVVA